MRRLLVALTICACSSPQSKQPPPLPSPTPVELQPPLEPVKDPKLEAYEKAKGEVERLRAEANKDLLLAVWTGPYGGVPPWDKVSVAAFSPAFTTGLALLAAEIDVIANNPEPATFANTIAAYDD